jgi:hypothetical protein
MVSKKSILWALVAIVAIATAFLWQHRRHQQNVAQSAHGKKHKSTPEAKPADKTPPAPKKEPKATVLSLATKENLAEKSFIAALRAIFIWRSTQPETPETSRVVLEKLSGVACDDLPPERKSAWQSLLQAWKSLADPAKATDPQIKAQSQRAAETLNAMFKAHGDGDIVF